MSLNNDFTVGLITTDRITALHADGGPGPRRPRPPHRPVKPPHRHFPDSAGALSGTLAPRRRGSPDGPTAGRHAGSLAAADPGVEYCVPTIERMADVSSARVGGSALIGREDELAALTAAYEHAASGALRIVLIGADAGAGKTTLVERFVADLADRAPAPIVVVGQCVPMGGEGLPYAPVVGVLRALQAEFGDDSVREWAGSRAIGILLPDLVEPEPPSESRQLQLFEAVTRLWQRAAAATPLVVVLEDLHWTDESSRTLLRFLARSLARDPVLVIATFRTDELNRRHPLRPFLADLDRLPPVSRLALPTLNRAQVAQLVARVWGHRPPATVTDEIHRRSDGVPFYVEELALAAERSGAAIPDTLRDALFVRLDEVGPAAREVLGVAAVGGNRLEASLLADVALDADPAPDLDGSLRAAVDAGLLLVDGGTFAFRHALLREAVYDDLLPQQRQRLHGRYAAALERRPELAGATSVPYTIALHWAAAGDADRAFAAALAAARSPGVAYSESLQMYERVLQLWDRVPDADRQAGRLDVVLDEAAKAATEAGETERGVQLTTQALTVGPADDVRRRIKRLLLRSRLESNLLRAGHTAADVAEATRLMPQVEDQRFRVRTIGQLAALTMFTGGDAIPLARDAVAAAAELGQPGLESDARNTLGSSLVNAGQEDEGLAELARAGELAELDERAAIRFRLNYSDSLHLTGHYRDAAREALVGIGITEFRGVERSYGTLMAGNAAEPLLALGEWDRAEELLQRALELEPAASQQAHLRLLLAWLTLWRGDVERAGEMLREHRALAAEDQPLPQYGAQALRVGGEHAVAVGDVDRAWSNLRWYVEHERRFDVMRELPVLAMGAAAAAILDRRDPAGRAELVRERLTDSPGATREAAVGACRRGRARRLRRRLAGRHRPAGRAARTPGAPGAVCAVPAGRAARSGRRSGGCPAPGDRQRRPGPGARRRADPQPAGAVGASGSDCRWAAARPGRHHRHRRPRWPD